MGDAPPQQGARTSEYQQSQYYDDSQHGDKPQQGQYTGPGTMDNAAFHSQYSGLPQQPRLDTSRTQHGMAPYGASAGQMQPFNMTSMAGALPEYQSPAQAQRVQGSTPVSAFRHAQIPHFPANSPYGTPYAVGQYQGGLGLGESGQSTMGSQGQRTGMPQSFSPYGQRLPQYYYPTSPFSPQGQQFIPGSTQIMSPYGDRRTSATPLQGPSGGMGMQVQGNRAPGIPAYGDFYATAVPLATGEVSGIQRPPSDSSMTSVPRGPPRKPKQSGHALWVGNLPPGTTVSDLKDHFSRDATKDIESLFLISKSNCAFVNYRSEASCTAAMQRFHDSRFHGVRLVCRLRRSSPAPAGVPSGPSAMTGSSPANAQQSQASPTIAQSPEVLPETDAKGGDDASTEAVAAEGKVQDKYFVVKSLTLQDLEMSVRNGIWATQSHNEQALNKAYEAAENVYLIFSANKSGEYFGYARMVSPISEDSTQVFTTMPRHEPTVEAADAPKVIPTEATEFAPRGHIIDDSARGTIFWEAEHSDPEDEKEKEGKDEAAEAPSAVDEPSGPQTWGKPFKVEWLSTNRLPFYRTRGLRNPWNANREVKIARDGTELEPAVGNRLLQMFHRMGQSQPPASAVPMAMLGGMPMSGPGSIGHY